MESEFDLNLKKCVLLSGGKDKVTIIEESVKLYLEQLEKNKVEKDLKLELQKSRNC